MLEAQTLGALGAAHYDLGDTQRALEMYTLALSIDKEIGLRRDEATALYEIGLTQPQPLRVREIQNQVLDRDSLLLEYSLGSERSYLWAVTPVSLTSYVLPKREEIEQAARRVYNLLSARNPHPQGETLEQRRRMSIEPKLNTRRPLSP